MPSRLEGTKQCHLIWMARGGRSWFKIAAAARFCEHAISHACATLGWTPEVIAVMPDRVHILVSVPLAQDRWCVSRRLQAATTALLADGRIVPDAGGSPWAGDGWCAVLPSVVAASAVRRVLREKLAVYRVSTPAGDEPP